MTKNTVSNARDVPQIRKDNLAPCSGLLPGPIELPKFLDALPEAFRNSDTVPDPSRELRADASG